MDRILPPEVITIILNNLSVSQKFSCRLVSKQFRSLVDNHVKVQRLTILGPNSTEFSKNWFFTNLPNDEHDLVFTQMTFLHSKICDELRIFSRLRSLFISFEDTSDQELNFEGGLNQLKQLRELNIRSTRLREGTTLSLLQLEILSLESVSGAIKLNTPKLVAFKSNGKLKNYQFIHPEATRYLFINHDEGVDQFVNLEILLSSNYSFFRVGWLQRLAKLKQLQAFREANDDGEYDDLVVFDLIYREKQRLKLNHLKMFVSGLEYPDYYQNAFHHEDETYLILENYANTLPILPFVRRLDYGDLQQVFVNGPPADLPSKLPNIAEVSSLDAAINLDDFFRFLKSCEALNSLTLDCKSLTDQHHYDRLASLCKKLAFLHLIVTDRSIAINFDFILNFKFLCGLVLKRELPYELIESLFIKLKTFKMLNFIYKGRLSGVTFNRNDRPPVQFGQSCNYFQFDSLEEFLRFLRQNRSLSIGSSHFSGN